MQFFKSVCAVAALAVSVAAQSLKFTSYPTNVETLHSYQITWVAPNNSPVTILLKQGNPANLRTVGTLTTTGTGGSYTWSPAYNLVSNTNYALEIIQGNENNYSGTIILNAGRTPGQGSVSPTPPAPVTPSTPAVPVTPSTPVAPYSPSTTVYESTTVVTSYCPSASVSTYVPPVSPPIVTAGTGTATGIPIPRNTTFYSATIPSTTVAPTYPPPASSTPAAPIYTTAVPGGAVGLDAHIAMVFGAAAVVAAFA